MGGFLRTVVSPLGQSTAKDMWLLYIFFLFKERSPNLSIFEQQGMTLRGKEAAPLLPGSDPKG